MPSLGRMHLNLILTITFITGLFSGAEWLQMTLQAFLVIGVGFGLIHLVFVPILTAFDYFIEHRHDNYDENRHVLYYKLAKHYAFAIWFPFSKLCFVLCEIFYASNFYRHYRDFGSEYEFSDRYHTERMFVLPAYPMKYHRKLSRIGFRYYVPPLLRKSRPFQGRVVGLYQENTNSYDVENPRYVLHLKVSEQLYGGLRFRGRNAEDLHVILTFDQVLFIRRLLEKAEEQYADLHVTLAMNLPFRMRFKRFFRILLRYQQQFYSTKDLFHGHRQSSINFVHHYVAQKGVEDFKFHSFTPNEKYARLSYREKLKDLKRRGALEKAPSIFL